MQCPNCKSEVLPGQLFCNNCGRSLSDLQPSISDATSEVDIQPTELTIASPPSNPPIDSTELIAAPVQQVAPIIPPFLATAAKLLIKDGNASYDIPAGRETIIGRTDPLDGIYPDIDLTEHDPATGVSRRHAAIHEQGGQWFVKDLNSTNYIVVNRQRVNPDQDFLLSDGDEIRFGRVVAVFRCS